MSSGSGLKDIFGPGSQFETRWVKSFEELTRRVEALRALGQKIVLTMGTFDVAHPGHYRYLEKAKAQGDVLIVGVDSDEKVRKLKGPGRPVVPQDERLEMLAHLRHVDLVFLKGADDPKWQLIRTVRPDVLIATKETYNQEQLESLKELCGEVVVLEPQATTSTSAKIRRILVYHLAEIETGLKDAREAVVQKIDEVIGILDKLKGGNS